MIFENNNGKVKPKQDFEKHKQGDSFLNSEFDLGLFIFILKKNAIWFLVLFSFSYAAAFFYLRYTPPVYESSSILQIRNSNTASNVLKVENLYGNEDDISADLEFIRSKEFFKLAIADLPLKISYFIQGQVLAFENYSNSSYLTEVVSIDSSILGTKIFIEFPDEKNVNVSYHANDKEFSKNFSISDTISFPHISLKIILVNYQQVLNEQNQLKKNEYFFVVNNMSSQADEYFRNLTVQLMNASAKTVKITFKDNNPVKAADISRTMAEKFIQYDVDRKSQSSKKVLEFLESQVGMVYDRLRSSETLIQQFQKDSKFGEKENITSMYTDRMNSMESEVVNLELEETLLNEIEKKMLEKGGEIDVYSIIPIITGAQFEGNIKELITGLHQLLRKKEEMLYAVTSSSEAAKSMDYQIQIQKKLLLESVKSLRNKISSRRSSIESKVKEYEKSFLDVPAKELEFARLQRIFSINEKFYTLLLEKRTEFSISKAGFVPEHLILERAKIPTAPISPNNKLIIIVFLLAAFIACSLLVVIRYFLHNTITSLSEVAKLSNSAVGVLGLVPKYNDDIPVSQLIVNKKPRSVMAEAFRTLRTNLQFISNTPGPKVVSITSTISGEGKTFVAINFAGIIAYSGKRVIIIDLDMRKPKIHIGFGSDNFKGMSTLLIGKDEVKNCIKNSEQPGLDFITAGPIPPNPSELIINGKLDSILDELKQSYEVVIIDNPPVGLVTDGMECMQKSDYPIYILRADFSQKTFIHNIDRLVVDNKLSNLSVVLNGVDMRRKSYYSYNYGYGYGYGYGHNYGYYEEEIIVKRRKKKKPFLKKLLNKD